VPNGPEDVFTSHDNDTTPTTAMGDTTSLHTINSSPPPSSPFISPHREHFGATPQRLARLADINADLEDRIDVLNEQIREDAESSNVRVRRLEKEIASLRAELSYTRERNEQLEVAREHDEEEEHLAKELRRQRTENLRAARQRRLTHGVGSIGSQAELAEQAANSSPRTSRIMDFAPKTTLADLKRILGRAERGANSEDDTFERGSEDVEDDSLVESPTTTLGGVFSNNTTKKNTAESLSFLEQLTDVERATLMRRQGSQFFSNSPIISHLEPAQSISASSSFPPTLSPHSTISSRSASLSKGTAKFDSFSKDTADLGPIGSRSKSGSLKLKKGHRRGLSVQRVALGNKAMLAMTNKVVTSPSKGKSRASLTPMSFVPPDSANAEPPSTEIPIIMEGSTSSSSITPSPSRIAAEPMTSTPKPTSIPLPSNLLKSPLNNFSFLNTISPDASLRSRLGMTVPGALDNIDAPSLKSEILGLGQDLNDDWRADFEQKMFGDLDLAELMSAKGDGTPDAGDQHEDNEEVNIGASTVTTIGADAQVQTTESALAVTSSAAMDALSAALDPMRRGELRDLDEHILPLGSLRDAPVEAFYLLDKATAARPSAWTDTTPEGPSPSGKLALEDGSDAHTRKRLGAGANAGRKQSLLNLPIEFPTLRVREDAWSLYPDEDDVDDASDDTEPPPPGGAARHDSQLIQSPIVRRERALSRLQQTHYHRLSSAGITADFINPAPSLSRRHGHRRKHRHHRRRQEPQSILKTFAQRMGVPDTLVPDTIPGQENIVEAEEDEYTDEEAEIEERSVLGVSPGLTDEPLSYAEDDEGYTTTTSSRFEPSDYRGTEPNSSLLRRAQNDNSDESDDRYNASVIAKKLHNTSMQTIVQLWMTVQFAALVVVFVYYAAKRGPKAVLAGSRGGGRDAAMVRSSRGVGGGVVSRRRQ
jgi:hypothetical protein